MFQASRREAVRNDDNFAFPLRCFENSPAIVDNFVLFDFSKQKAFKSCINRERAKTVTLPTDFSLFEIAMIDLMLTEPRAKLQSAFI